MGIVATRVVYGAVLIVVPSADLENSLELIETTFEGWRRITAS